MPKSRAQTPRATFRSSKWARKSCHSRDAIAEVIAAKETGHRIEPAAEPLTAGKVVDLMAALQQSVQDAKAARGDNTAPADVHDLPTGKKTAKKAAKRAPAKRVPGAAKKAAPRRKPRSA
ncbi:hypothetical protein ACFWA6_09170 [Streptomyces sp. NPDC060020]|uniref:hypothetical protein n=1 Tax=Streptomyces sp. NPDC060020 TaxID=3347038 RepID=UPI0036CFD898